MNNGSKNKKYNRLSVITIFVLVAIVFSCVSPFFNNVNEVYATNNVSYIVDNGDNLKMTCGASVRTQSQDDSGLRFLVEYNKTYVDNLKSKVGFEYKSVSFGAFIVPNDYRNHYGITHQGLAGKNVIDINIGGFLSNSSDGWYKANVSMINIKSQNYDRVFMSRHYIKLVHSNDDVEYIYAPLTTEPRSVYNVAKMAFGDRTDYSSEKYINDTGKSGNFKFSPYDNAQLSIIKSFIDAIVIIDKETRAYAGGLDSALYTPAYAVNSDKINSTNKIAKMFWNDGTKIQGSINGSTAKFNIAGANSGRAKRPVYSYSFNVIGGNDVMPIMGRGIHFENKAEEHLYDNAWTNGGWLGGSQAQAEYWMPQYKELGINLIEDATFYGDSYPYVIKNLLSVAEQYNIGVFVTEYALNQYCYGEAKTQAELDSINTRMNELSTYDSFVAYTLRDEPCTKAQIGYMKNAKNSLLAGCSSMMLNRTFFINLLPYNPQSSDYDNDFGTSPSITAYKNYIDYVVKELNPKFLSYDMYPFRVYTNGRADVIDIAGYFQNLSTIRERANYYQIPFWYYVQCGSDWDDSGTGANMPSNDHKSRPTEGEFRWLVNTTLAYGAKGIEYFEAQQQPMFTKSGDDNPNYSRNGIWGYNGQRNEWYDYALEANNQIKAIDEYLMNATQEGLIVGSSASSSSLIPAGDKRNSYYELSSISGNVIVGCFNYKGRTALYVVNDSTSGSGACTLNFNGNYTYTQVRNATKTTSIISGNQISLSGLKAGEGVLIVLD